MDGNSLDSWFMIGAIFLAAGREKKRYTIATFALVAR
jgi:hypothetical protein